jgi:hypothetical protein
VYFELLKYAAKSEAPLACKDGKVTLTLVFQTMDEKNAVYARAGSKGLPVAYHVAEVAQRLIANGKKKRIVPSHRQAVAAALRNALIFDLKKEEILDLPGLVKGDDGRGELKRLLSHPEALVYRVPGPEIKIVAVPHPELRWEGCTLHPDDASRYTYWTAENLTMPTWGAHNRVATYLSAIASRDSDLDGAFFHLRGPRTSVDVYARIKNLVYTGGKVSSLDGTKIRDWAIENGEATFATSNWRDLQGHPFNAVSTIRRFLDMLAGVRLASAETR